MKKTILKGVLVSLMAVVGMSNTLYSQATVSSSEGEEELQQGVDPFAVEALEIQELLENYLDNLEAFEAQQEQGRQKRGGVHKMAKPKKCGIYVKAKKNKKTGKWKTTVKVVACGQA